MPVNGEPLHDDTENVRVTLTREATLIARDVCEHS